MQRAFLGPVFDKYFPAERVNLFYLSNVFENIDW